MSLRDLKKPMDMLESERGSIAKKLAEATAILQTARTDVVLAQERVTVLTGILEEFDSHIAKAKEPKAK